MLHKNSTVFYEICRLFRLIFAKALCMALADPFVGWRRKLALYQFPPRLFRGSDSRLWLSKHSRLINQTQTCQEHS